MSRTDLVADVLTIIRNAIRVQKTEVIVPYSNLIKDILKIMHDEGYIDNYKEIEIENKKNIKVYLKYVRKKSAIKDLKRISKPGRRVYVSKDDIPQVMSGYGIAIISTSQGVITNKQAEEKGVGGEVLCYVW